MKLFQEPMNVMSASVPSAGPSSGSTTRHQIANSLQPSSRAASTRSRGIADSMYCRIRKMPSAPHAPGMISARCSLVQPSQLIVSAVGTMKMKPGSSIVSITAA